MVNYFLSKIRWNKIAFLALSLFLFLTFYVYYRSVMPYTYGDTAFLIEIVANLTKNSQPVSELLAQNWAGIALTTAKIEVYCQENLVAGMFTSDPYNWFSSLHAYVILYLIAPVANVFGALNTLSFFMALGFSLIPVMAYSYLRGAGASVAVSVLATAICMIHPAWQISSAGQFYVDRFFVPVAMMFTLQLHRYLYLDTKIGIESRFTLLTMLILGVLGGLTSERHMFVVGVFSMGYALVSSAPIRKKVITVFFAILCFSYVFVYLKWFGGSKDNSAMQLSLFNINSLIDAARVPGVGEYLWFNGLLLVFSAVYSFRTFVCVVPIVAINCFITMGGAEKNVWATHYHSHYYGFLMAAFLIAISKIKCRIGSVGMSRNYKGLLLLLAGVAFSLMASTAYFYKGQGIFVALWDYYGSPKIASSSRGNISMFRDISKDVPVGATVSTPEWGMPAWYLRGNKVKYYPVGVGQSDFVVAQSVGVIPNIKLVNAVRYVGDSELANECIANKISTGYSEVSRVGTWVLFKKK